MPYSIHPGFWGRTHFTAWLSIFGLNFVIAHCKIDILYYCLVLLYAGRSKDCFMHVCHDKIHT